MGLGPTPKRVVPNATMATALIDAADDDRREPLPPSVELVLARAGLGATGTVVTEDLLRTVLQNQESERDSNLDFVQTVFELEVLADGHRALLVLIEGLRRRLRYPVLEREDVRLVFTARWTSRS